MDASKLRYSSERGVGSYDIQLSIEATSRESVKQLDALYALGDAIFVAQLKPGPGRTPFDVKTRTVRVEGEHGRAKCIFFNAKKAVDPRSEPIAFLEGPDGGDFKVCINEEGRVESTLRIGVSKDPAPDILIDLLRVRIDVPKKGADTGVILFTTYSSGCHGLGVH